MMNFVLLSLKFKNSTFCKLLFYWLTGPRSPQRCGPAMILGGLGPPNHQPFQALLLGAACVKFQALIKFCHIHKLPQERFNIYQTIPKVMYI